MNIPFLSFDHTNKIIKAEMLQTFEKVFDSNWYILGESVKQFEKEYAAFSQTKFCVGVSNGLDAITLSLLALGIGKGDEVILPSNTYIATVLAVSYVGATPVFAEPYIDTFNFDAKNAEAVITSSTKAIIPVHLYGQCCDMESIMQLAEKYNLFIVEDNAQSHGASFNGKLAGSWGNANATSFYPGKNLGALGDAGAITTNDETIADKIKMLRNYGSNKKYYNEIIGFNKRLDELQAAFLSVKLKYLQQFSSQRQEIALWYDAALADVKDVILPKTKERATHVYHLYVIRTNERDALQQYLKSKNIDTLIHYPVPPHLQKAYAHLGFVKGDFPIAEKMADTCLSLPVYPGITKKEVEYVCENIKHFSSLVISKKG
jgi:dTDP-4-amino-4,6-dideoxygalactose transaminase